MKRMGVRDGGAQSGGATLSGAAQGEARLLVVEDDPNILELLSASLRFAGFAVSTATNGATGSTAAPASAGMGPKAGGKAGAARPRAATCGE